MCTGVYIAIFLTRLLLYSIPYYKSIYKSPVIGNYPIFRRVISRYIAYRKLAHRKREETRTLSKSVERSRWTLDRKAQRANSVPFISSLAQALDYMLIA